MFFFFVQEIAAFAVLGWERVNATSLPRVFKARLEKKVFKIVGEIINKKKDHRRIDLGWPEVSSQQPFVFMSNSYYYTSHYNLESTSLTIK